MFSPRRVDFAHSNGKTNSSICRKPNANGMPPHTPIHRPNAPHATAPHAITQQSHAPLTWHSCRRRHPAAAVCSPRDHCKRQKSAPSIHPARRRRPMCRHMCAAAASAAQSPLSRPPTCKQWSGRIQVSESSSSRENISKFFCLAFSKIQYRTKKVTDAEKFGKSD